MATKRRRRGQGGLLTPVVPYLDDRIRLRDGRRLGFACYGDPGGDTVFWFHGTPGARRQLPPNAPAAARERGFRIVGVDRPGIGGSSPHDERTLLTWTEDVAELADYLNAERYSAIGLSGGGPYVLACAHEHPDRVMCGVSLGGVGPVVGYDGAPGYSQKLHGLMRFFAKHRRAIGHLLSVVVQPLRPLASPGFDLYVRFGPQEDRPVFERPEMKAMFIHDIVMATKYGIRGPVWDVALFSQPWPFDPAHIRVPVRIWHGDVDTIVPLSHSEHLCEVIPDCELRVMDGLGHFAGFVNAEDVLDEIRKLWPGARRDSDAPARVG